MSAQRDTASSDTRAQRRWLIGLGITVLFGIFGAVMAVLAYSNQTSTPGPRGPAGTSAPAPAGSPTTVPDHPGRGKDHK